MMRGNHPRRRNTAPVVVTAALWTLFLILCITVSQASVAPHSSDAAGTLWDSSWGEEEEEAFEFDDDDEERLLVEGLPPVVVEEEEEEASRSAAATVAEEDDEIYSKDDWWKDPLSMFDEDDEFVEDAEAVEEPEEEAIRSEEESVGNEQDGQIIVDDFDDAEEEAFYDDEVVDEMLDEEDAAAAAELAALEEAEAEAEKTAAKKAKQQGKTEATSGNPLKQKFAFLKNSGQQDREEKKAAHQKGAKASYSGGSSASLAALSASVPALKTALAQGTLLAASLPAVKVLATMAVGKAVYETVLRKKSQKEQGFGRDDPQVEDEYNAILMENPMHYSLDDPSRFSDDEEEFEYGTDLDSDVDSSTVASHSSSSNHNHHHNHQVSKNIRNDKHNSGGQQGGVFGGIRSVFVGSGNSRTPIMQGAPTGGGLLTRKVRVTADELEFLKVQAERAMMERQNMEQEYEKTSFQLQEAQSEVTQLASTTKYLKSQLRDYEEMMDRTVRNERRKAKAEIQRVKDTLNNSREQDQEALRRQFLKEMNKMQRQFEAERAERDAMTLRAGGSSYDGDAASNNHDGDYEPSIHDDDFNHGDFEESGHDVSDSSQQSAPSKKPKSAKKNRKND